MADRRTLSLESLQKKLFSGKQRPSLQSLIGLLLLCCVLAPTSLTFAQSPSPREDAELPYSMASLGDSITAGALASFPRQFAWNPFFHFKILINLVAGIVSQSIAIAEKRPLNWSTGDDIRYPVTSHYRRLRYLSPHKINVYNPAKSGAVAKDLIDIELPKMFDWSRRYLKQEAPDYVTLLIGANDVCANTLSEMTPVEKYDEQVAEILDEILKRSPRTKILVSSLPRIHSMKEVADRAWVFPIPGLNLCRDLWRLLKFCPVAQLGTTPARLAEVERRVRDYNSVLERNVASMSRKHGNRVRFSKGVWETELSPDHLAIDCFHPNQYGQKLISERTWADTWWASQWARVSKQAERDFAREARCSQMVFDPHRNVWRRPSGC